MRQTEEEPLKKMYEVSEHSGDLAGGRVEEKYDERKVMISGRGNDNRKIRFHSNVYHAVLTEENTERKPENPGEWSH
jgi:hypothetical protein